MQLKAIAAPFCIEQIVPYFQPIFDLDTHTAIRYECLARQVNEFEQINYPSEFLYVIERNQISAQLTKRMLELSMAYCLPREMRFSVNLFVSDLSDACLIHNLQELFAEHPAKALGIELSYHNVKHQPQVLRQFIKQLPNLHVTIDDVYDDENELKSIIGAGVDAIKLRGTMTTDLLKTNSKQQTLSNVVDICSKADCKLIAEHIEDERCLQLVKETGIKYGQGFHLSMPAERSANLKQV